MRSQIHASSTNSSHDVLAPVSHHRSPWYRGVQSILRSRSATAGAVIVLLLVLMVLIGPALAPYDPVEQNLRNRYEGPSLSHPLGTDQFGRDLLSRVLHGARISLSLSIGAVGLALMLGVPIGLISGYVGRWVDTVVVGIVDILLTFPTYLLAIFIVSVVGPSLTNIALAVGFSTLPTIVRVVRGDTLSVKNWELIIAARSLGAGTGRILFVHIFPNILSSIAVVATLRLGTAILVESSLSFLGLGLSAPQPAWGLMVNEGLRFLSTSPRLVLVPGIAIMVTVLGFNLFGDGLRDALDPRLRGRND